MNNLFKFEYTAEFIIMDYQMDKDFGTIWDIQTLYINEK